MASQSGFKVQLSRESNDIHGHLSCITLWLYTRKMLVAYTHHGGEPAEQAKGANGMQLCVVDCRVDIVDAKRDECLLV